MREVLFISKGDKGDHFYIIESGEAIATKVLSKGKAPSRAASIIAKVTSNN